MIWLCQAGGMTTSVFLLQSVKHSWNGSLSSSLTPTESSVSVSSGDSLAAISFAKRLVLHHFSFVSSSMQLCCFLALSSALFLLFSSLRFCKHVLMWVLGWSSKLALLVESLYLCWVQEAVWQMFSVFKRFSPTPQTLAEFFWVSHDKFCWNSHANMIHISFPEAIIL